MEIRLLESAEKELNEAGTSYHSEQAGLGADFIVEFVNSLERIKAYPQAWHPFSENTRRYQLRRFPYGIISQILENEVFVVAIAHLHREPGYWQTEINIVVQNTQDHPAVL